MITYFVRHFEVAQCQTSNQPVPDLNVESARTELSEVHGGPSGPSVHRNPVKRQGDCYPSKGALFNVPSDGHKNICCLLKLQEYHLYVV